MADSLHQLEERVAALLESGQVFIAQDLAGEGLKAHPESVRLRMLVALALIRTGAVAEAVATLKPVLARFDTKPLLAAKGAIQATLASLKKDPEGRAALAAVAELVHSLDAVRNAGLRQGQVEPDLLTRLGELHLEAWQKVGDPALLETAHTLLEEGFALGGDVRAGASAAVTLHLLGRAEAAGALAAQVLAAPGPAGVHDGEAAFKLGASRGLAALLAGKAGQAVDLFGLAVEDLGRRSPQVVPFLRLARRLRAGGVKVPADVDMVLKPPGVVVFTGHMMDRPGQAEERFPPRLEAALRAEIARRLERMDVQVGYSGAACGSELLFVEALLERDGEANIVLPFDTEDYVATNVAFAGTRWERRFRNVLRLAHSVVHATQENWLGHEQLFRFQNQMLHGLSTLRAEFLETAPNLLAVWDMMEGSLSGGAADFIDQWADISRLQIIDIDEIRYALPEAAEAVTVEPGKPPAPRPVRTVAPERVIRAMLFADLVGYSKLSEAAIPYFMEFLGKIAADLGEDLPKPEVINTWGDAVFAVMPRATDLARFAFALQEAIRKHRTTDKEAGIYLDIRISLHAGPVFMGRDPFNDRPNFFGSHINRAARLEPVTVPGHIYATQQFVALLTTEESQRRHEAEAAGEDFAPVAACSYVGVMSLAKNFGKDAVYHVQPATGLPVT